MNLADLTYLHLLLNNVPTVGLLCGLALLPVSLIVKNEHLLQAALVVLFLVAVMAFPTFVSGYAAHTAIQARPGYAPQGVEAHQAAALLAMMFLEVTGVIAWIALWQIRQFSRPVRWVVPAVLILSTVAMGLMTRAANLGGEITHAEIRAAQQVVATDGASRWELSWLTTPSMALFASTYRWTWPLCEIVHFLGLCLLFGVVLLVNLRILGVGRLKNASFIELHRLLPWGVAGFTLNAVSGMVFYTVAPQTYTQNLAFDWKMVFIVLAASSVLYFTLADEPWTLHPGVDASVTAKVFAGAQILLWVGVIYFGRMLPYLTGGAFAGAQ